MWRLSATCLLIVCASSATATAGQANPDVVLDSAAVELRIARSPVAHVGRLVHKKSGIAAVAEPWDRDLFSIVLEGDRGASKTVAASEARRSQVEVHEAAGAREAVLQWSDFPGADLTVRATVRVAPAEPLLLWSLEIDNRSRQSLSLVRFPRIAAVARLGQPADDFLVLPALPGVRIDDPADNWPPGYGVTLRYPGQLSAQFLAYQDPTAGVYLAGRDAGSHPMALGVKRHKQGLLLWHEFTPLAARRGKWTAPYAVAVGATQGTWCDSADVYKRWAMRQPWCARTLARRDDVPGWWKQGPDVHVFEVRTYDKQRTSSGSYYPRVMDHLRAYRERIGGPVVAMLAGWENHRRWTAGDYFPICDQAQARQVIGRMRGEGFRPFFFLSGLYYTFENEGRDGGTIAVPEKWMPHFVVDAKTGKPATYTLDESSPPHTWKRHSYQFCVGDPATREFFCDVVDRAHALGVDVLQMDQTVAGGGAACYAAGHGHAPGPGLYQTLAFQELLKTMRDRGKRNTPDFVLCHEEPHEQLIPLLDGFHVREYYAKRWYRAYRGAVGIPLFAYLYHEYAIGYGGDGAGLSPHESRRNVRAHALNLVTGRTPGGAVWSSPQSAIDAHPDQVAMLRNHCRLLRTRAGRFLMLGRMLHPLELDVPKVVLRWSGRGKDGKTSTTEDPAVLTSSWQSPSGAVGHLLVNISEKPQAVSFPVDTRNAPGWPSCDASLYSSRDDAGFRPLWKDAKLPKAFSRELQPLEVVFIELEPAGKPK